MRRAGSKLLILAQVDWDGEADEHNPLNCSVKKKWIDTILVSTFATLYPVASTAVAPAITKVSQDLQITSAFESGLVLSIFLLGIGFGPLILAPLSEVYGRVPVLMSGNVFFIVWNTVCGFARSGRGPQILAFRILAGFGASVSLATGTGVISDLWPPEQRGRAISIYASGPLLGPAIAPIIGGFIAQNEDWRWIFWGLSIAAGAFLASAATFLRETYPPQILRRKAWHLRKQTGDHTLDTRNGDLDRPKLPFLLKSLSRPPFLIVREPLIQLAALYALCVYGLMYVILYTFPQLWTSQYHESVSIGGLNYISTGLAFIAGTSGIHLRIGRWNMKLTRSSCRSH